MNFLFRNASWQFLNTVITIAFPLAVFPYISRLFGPANLGELNYVDSWVKLLLLVTTLGLHTYGVREIASAPDTSSRARRLYQLIFLHGALILLAIIFFSLFELQADKTGNQLFILAIVNLAIHPFLAEWYFHGTYQFRLLLALNLVTKLALLAGIFLLINEREDLVFYYLLFTIAQVATAIACAATYLRQCRFRQDYLERTSFHIQPMLLLLLTMGGISIFVYLDIIVLNYLRTETETGIYSVGIKVVRIISYLFNASIVILLPVLANHFANKDRKEIDRVAGKSIQLLLLIALPSLPGLYFLSVEIVNVLSGEAFLEGSVILRICAALPLIVAVSNLLGIQLLVAIGKEKELVKIVIASIVIGLPLLVVLTTLYSYTGTAVAVMTAEAWFFVMTLVAVRNELRISWHRNFLWAMLITGMLPAVVIYLVSVTQWTDIVKILAAFVFSAALVLLTLRYVVRDLLKGTENQA